jgi:tyrosyl-tRNA synthetase
VLKADAAAGRNPRDLKVALAQEIVTRFQGAAAAVAALAAFEARFRDGVLPENMPVVKVGGAPLGILKVLRESGLVASGAEAQRNVEQGGVKINGEKVADKSLQLSQGEYVLQVGKRRVVKLILMR